MVPRPRLRCSRGDGNPSPSLPPSGATLVVARRKSLQPRLPFSPRNEPASVKTGTGIQCAAPQPPVGASLRGCPSTLRSLPPLVGAGLTPLHFIGRTPRPFPFFPAPPLRFSRGGGNPSPSVISPSFPPAVTCHYLTNKPPTPISHSLVGAVREPPFPSFTLMPTPPPSSPRPRLRCSRE